MAQRGRGGRGGRRDGGPTRAPAASDVPPSEIVLHFQKYSADYDEVTNSPSGRGSCASYQLSINIKNDRRERLVKRSRDITIGSKRLIFLLHRIWDSSKDEIKAQAIPPLEKIKEDIRAIQSELKDHAYWKYEPAFTPEFVESISFMHYLLHDSLISISQINAELSTPEAPSFSISLKDYILGLADLTGECMRLAVTSAAKGNMDLCKSIRQFLGEIHSAFLFLSSSVDVKDLEGKIEVMSQSLAKVDQVCFKVAVRKGEFPEEVFKFVDDDDGPTE